MNAHEIDYEIFGEEMQYVEIELDPQEGVIAESGSFMMMDTNIKMDTILGDGSGQSESILGKIFSAGKMLHMVEPGATQVYMGVKSYRGIAVDTWQSCQYWDAYDATMHVTWYFTGMMIYKC